MVVTLSTWGIHGRDSTFVAPRATLARYCVTKQPRKRNSRRVQHWGSWGWAIPTGECPPVSGTLLAAAVAGSWRDPIPWPACRAGGASRERPGGVVPQLQVCPRSQALETTNCPSPPKSPLGQFHGIYLCRTHVYECTRPTPAASHGDIQFHSMIHFSIPIRPMHVRTVDGHRR